MLPVEASPFRIRQEMRAGLEEELNGKSARLFFRFMGNFNKKSCHRTNPLSLFLAMNMILDFPPLVAIVMHILLGTPIRIAHVVNG
jgi:hypothetical protein